MKNVFIVATILFWQNSVWAGPSVGGGGDVIILPDDSVVLADPFIDSGAPQPNNMPPLRALNPRILQVINLYNKASTSLITDLADKESDINGVLSKLATRNNDLRFYGVQTVEELNQFCAPGGRKIYKLPNGAQVQQVACTAGNETFMVEPLFARLSLRDQGLLLVHERLTTLRDQYGGKNYSAIARFTTGLNLYLSLYGEQTKKKYRELTDVEQKILSDFYVAIEEIEKRNSEITDNSFQWGAHKNGGGRVHVAAIVDESAFISLNSVITKGSEIGANVKIKNFYNEYLLPLIAEENASIDTLVTSYYVNRNYPQYSVKPSAQSMIKVKANSSVVQTQIHNNIDGVTIGEDSQLKNVQLSLSFFNSGTKLSLKDTALTGKVIKIGNNVSVEGSKLSSSERIDIKDDVQMTNVSSENHANITFSDKANLNGVTFHSSEKGSAYINSRVEIKSSAISAEHFEAGAGTKIENTKIAVAQIKLGTNVEFNNANIIHGYLSAFVANDQKLIGQDVLQSTYQAYYPLGFVPAPINFTKNIPTFRCTYPEKPHTKSQAWKKDLLNTNKEGIVLSGTSMYQGKVGPFEQQWNYDYLDFKMNINYKTFTRTDDKSLLIISNEGKFVNPDYKRENLVVDLSSLPSCMRQAIAAEAGALYISDRGSIVIPSDYASKL